MKTGMYSNYGVLLIYYTHKTRMKEGKAMTVETANRLYELRKEHGLSQEDLAEKLGVSRQAVSKWERSEASPDTDNLIALAKIYNLSLDELVFGEQKTEKEPRPEPDFEPQSEENKEHKKDTTKVDIGPNGIFIESEDGDKVQINLRGIKITEKKSDEDDEEDDDGDNDDVIIHDGHFHISVDKPKHKGRFWLEILYPILCTAAYLLFGFMNICGGWAYSWIIFMTIPLYHSLIEAICNRKFSDFSWSVLTACAYLYMGLYQKIWHPSWLIFLTVPIYHCIASSIDDVIKRHKEEREIL